jgi:hypothetical protein
LKKEARTRRKTDYVMMMMMMKGMVVVVMELKHCIKNVLLSLMPLGSTFVTKLKKYYRTGRNTRKVNRKVCVT